MTMIVTHTTYDPDGQLFAHSVIPIIPPFCGDVASTVAWKRETGWIVTSVNQVAKVDESGFLDVLTYTEEMER